MFDLVYVLTGGGPGTATEPIALYTFNALLQHLRFGYGSALSVIVFLVTFALALVYIRVLGATLTGGAAMSPPAAIVVAAAATRCSSRRCSSRSTGRSLRRSRPRRGCSRRRRSCRRAVMLDHYRALFDERDFWAPIRNSLVVAGADDAAVPCRSAALCAYALARLRFPRQGARCWRSCWRSRCSRRSRSCSPLYLLLRALRLINTYPGLVLPYLTFAMPLTVWLLVGFFRQLPPELEEAAMVDGASAAADAVRGSCCRCAAPGSRPRRS